MRQLLRKALVLTLSMVSAFTATVWASHQIDNEHWGHLQVNVCNAATNTSSHPYKNLLQLEWADWSVGTNLNLVSNCDTPQITLTNADYGATGWFGHVDKPPVGAGGHLSSAKVKLNEFHLDRKSDQCVQGTACHEIGHALGLAHVDSTSCMDPDWNAFCNSFNVDFDAHDAEMVNSISHGCGEHL